MAVHACARVRDVPVVLHTRDDEVDAAIEDLPVGPAAWQVPTRQERHARQGCHAHVGLSIAGDPVGRIELEAHLPDPAAVRALVPSEPLEPPRHRLLVGLRDRNLEVAGTDVSALRLLRARGWREEQR